METGTMLSMDTVLTDIHAELSTLLTEINPPQSHAWLYQCTADHATVTELIGDYNPHAICTAAIDNGAQASATLTMIDSFSPCVIAYVMTTTCYDIRRATISLQVTGLQLRSWECML